MKLSPTGKFVVCYTGGLILIGWALWDMWVR